MAHNYKHLIMKNLIYATIHAYFPSMQHFNLGKSMFSIYAAIHINSII
jgi:hypothetical protein